jgi:hypothetical protein
MIIRFKTEARFMSLPISLSALAMMDDRPQHEGASKARDHQCNSYLPEAVHEELKTMKTFLIES